MTHPEEIVTLFKSLLPADDINEFRESLKSGLRNVCRSNPLVTRQFGYCLLNKFIQFNWTGPKEEKELILPFVPEELKTRWDRACLKDEHDGETWYELITCPHLLSISDVIFIGNMIEDYEGCLWAMRCLFVQQQLLNVKSNTLWNKLQTVIEKLVKLLVSTEIRSGDLCTCHLEISNCLLYHAQYDQALSHLKLARQSAGIGLELSGAMGKRTKFQKAETAQLILKVSHFNGDDVTPSNSDESPSNQNLPKDVFLEDDTLLSHVTFSDESGQSIPMSPVQQAVVLCQCIHQKWTSPVHRLTTEQLEAYLEQLLSQPKCWVIQSMALYLRSVFEKKRSRHSERSMMQLQELVDLYSKPFPEAAQRLELFYCASHPPHWIIEKELADVLVELGARQSALEIYERLHLWDEVISCYHAVGRRGQAERVVRERMAEEGESVKLWCLLGDASQDHTCYKKAWELSNQKSARAQKSLGLYYLSKENYKECEECLQKSLDINPMQDGLWFTLGHAASKLEDHGLAAQAFRQCVTLQPDNYEAWNNLAGEYLKKKDKVRAFNAFQEALKCNYENWKIWENYLIVSTEIGEFEETIRAYHRLLDIKRKHLDAEVLGYVTDSVVGDIVMHNGKQENMPLSDESAKRHFCGLYAASLLRSRLGELLARVVSQTTGSSELWEVCAKFHLSSSDVSERDKGLIELQKAQRTARQTPGWETSAERRERVFDLTLRYSEACRTNRRKENAQQISSSARLCLQGVISKLKDVMELEADRKEMFEKMIQQLIEEQKRLELQEY